MTTLLNSKVGVDGGIASSSSKVLALTVGDMLAITLNVTLGQSEVKDEDLVTGLVESDAEVIRFDVTVDEVPVVNVLGPTDHLIDEHQDTLETELAEGLVEE